MKSFGLGVVLAMAMGTMACGSSRSDATSTSALHLTGTVDTQYRALDNARAVAVGSDGRTFSAYLTSRGEFALDLPVGQTYRIFIANATMSGELRTIGHLVNATSSGAMDVLTVREGGSMALGVLRPESVSGTTGTMHTSCECDASTMGSGSDDSSDDDAKKKSGDDGKDDMSDGGAKDDDGDFKCHEHDDDKDKMCDDADDVGLKAEHAPGDKCKPDSDASMPPSAKGKACKSKDKDHDGKDDDDDAKADGGASSGGSGSGSASGTCMCSKECAKGSTCVASKCVPSSGSGTGSSSSSSGSATGSSSPPPSSSSSSN